MVVLSKSCIIFVDYKSINYYDLNTILSLLMIKLEIIKKIVLVSVLTPKVLLQREFLYEVTMQE